MLILFKIAFAVILAVLPSVCPCVAWSYVDPEEGQALFDQIFWQIMSLFVLGFTAGLAIKFLNRS